MEKTILTILKQVETAEKNKQRWKESPVYQDSYGSRTATLLASTEKPKTKVRATPATGKETK